MVCREISNIGREKDMTWWMSTVGLNLWRLWFFMVQCVLEPHTSVSSWGVPRLPGMYNLSSVGLPWGFLQVRTVWNTSTECIGEAYWSNVSVLRQSGLVSFNEDGLWPDSDLLTLSWKVSPDTRQTLLTNCICLFHLLAANQTLWQYNRHGLKHKAHFRLLSHHTSSTFMPQTELQ